jgi:hypothetical protein
MVGIEKRPRVDEKRNGRTNSMREEICVRSLQEYCGVK